MIVREWRAWARNADAYASHFRRNVLPELQALGGFLGASLLQHQNDGVIELLVLSRWSSMDAIREFAGDDVSRAVVEQEAIAVLLRYDQRVKHYEVLEDAQAQ
jgi:heme-degrading monooxygenase HmoA